MARESRTSPARHERGFTLIEVVVSLAILALSLGVLYQSFGWSARRTAKLASEEVAWLAAQSLLAEIRARPTLAEGSSEGEWPWGLRWHARIEGQASSVDSESPLQAFAVTIEVRWGQRSSQQLRLQSVEIGRVRP